MNHVRKEIRELGIIGALPSEDGADPELIKRIEALYRSIIKPITDDEARVLVELLGNDGCFGIAYSFVHLIETAPGWPLEDCLRNSRKNLVVELRNRAILGGQSASS